MTSLLQQRNTFVVRIWWEQADPVVQDQQVWRGWVQHAASGQATYVSAVDDLLEFIEQWTGQLIHSPKPTAGLK